MGNNGSIVERQLADKTNIDDIEDVLTTLQTGFHMTKIHYTGKKRVLAKRVLLDEDKLAFRYLPTVKGKDFKIPITSITNVNNRDSVQDDLIYKKSPEKQIVVTYEDKNKTSRVLGLIAENEKMADLWATGFNHLITNANLINNIEDPLHQSWLSEAFDNIDIDKNGALDLQEISRLFRLLNLPVNEDVISKQFEKHNTEGPGGLKQGKLTREEFARFFKNFRFNEEEVLSIFNEYNRNQTHQDVGMNTSSLKNFLRETQKEELNFTDCENIVAKYDSVQDCITAEGLLDYLLSEENNIGDPKQLSLHQNMNLPLNHYFISSSHNTYLLEDQLKGPSSTEAYANALRMGCKCVELDCWDGENNEPVIYHGHTLTSKILFKDVIKAIDKHAFVVSDYPLMLSMENHCSVPQQKIMAQHLKSILKERLFAEPLDPDREQLPSPNSLRGKILIKGKKCLFLSNAEQEKDEDGFVTDEDEAKRSMRKVLNASDSATIDGIDVSQLDLTDGNTRASLKKKKQKKVIKLEKEFSDLVNYLQSVSFVSFDHAMENQAYFQMSSISESKFLNLSKAAPQKFIQYNRNFLTRLYPGAVRYDSTNYNPVLGWETGSQIVALNFQTMGEMLEVYSGMFALNGRAGYILKPSCLRDSCEWFDPHNVGTFDNNDSHRVNIRIVSGHLLPKMDKRANTDCYVKLNIHGVKQDQVLEKFRTKTVMNNGFNPVWCEEFQFNLHAPELAHVRLAVYDQEIGFDDFIGQYSIPYMAIRSGYRRVPLFSKSAAVIPRASLLVHITSTLLKEE